MDFIFNTNSAKYCNIRCNYDFLVACTRLYNPLCPSVGQLVGRSVDRSHFTFFYYFISLTSLLLPKGSGDLKYGPCPPTRDFGSRVSGLVFVQASCEIANEVLQPHISWTNRNLSPEGHFHLSSLGSLQPIH